MKINYDIAATAATFDVRMYNPKGRSVRRIEEDERWGMQSPETWRKGETEGGDRQGMVDVGHP